jgi:hypothetical protein
MRIEIVVNEKKPLFLQLRMGERTIFVDEFQDATSKDGD